MTTVTLVARMDAIGDVLLAGPAVRAVAHRSDQTVFLCGPRGKAAAELLPGVDEVLTWSAPWIDPGRPPPVESETRNLVQSIVERGVTDAVILTSDHQSPLPLAMLLRFADVRRISAISHDFAGSLLDVRVADPGDVAERLRALATAMAAGFALPDSDSGRLQVQARPYRSLPQLPYVVLHPGTSVSARAWPRLRWIALGELLAARGVPAVVTGSSDEKDLTSEVAEAACGLDLGGATELAELASVMQQAAAVVVANTGPAHLAAAVDAPIVSLFAPTVPAARWAPDASKVILLGDSQAACAGTRATSCPIPGHPCLTSVSAEAVAGALESLSPQLFQQAVVS